jgi:DNA-binding transcriptional LysR family regulator
MDRLQSMQVFVRVAQHAGFAPAARELRISTAAVSKHVTALEARIGTRLLDRTTRRVGLTEAGRVYLDHCLECLQAFEHADASISQLANEPRGSLRMTAPIDFAEHLLPVLAEVMNAHPDLSVDLQLSNRVVDMVEEGIDVGIRIARSLDGQFVARPLARTRLSLFGAPEYFRRYGRPRKPADLASHRGIVFVEPRPVHEFVFTRGGREVRARLNTVMTTNQGDAARQAMLQGIGIGPLPSFLAQADMAAGRIEPVLVDWSLQDYRVFAVYPHRRFLSPKVRVLVEALVRALGDGSHDPWWPDGPARTDAAEVAAKRTPKRARGRG